MTGTGKTAEKEFRDIYGLDVVVLPTAKPMIRKDFSDLVYQNEFSKWKAILSKAKECFEKGQPILIGTSNVEKSEFLSELFTTSGIPHEILNAKPENLSRESEIIAQAGKLFSVTIATNMAGRGTDIILGGNPTFKVKQILISIFYEKFALKRKSDISVGEFKNKNHDKINLTETIDFYFAKIIEEYQNNYTLLNQTLNSLDLLEKHIKNIPYSLDNCFNSLRFLYNFLYEKIYMEWQEQNIQVKNLGGLFVLGTERHETRRIDNQLRGRAGRQGDPGISQFFISLEDELIKIFGNENIRRWISFVIDDPDNPLESSFLTKSLDQAQEKVELYNYEIRKNVFQYDEIINSQRKQFFEARKNLLTSSFYHELGLRFVEFDIDINFIKKINCKNKKIFLRQLERYFSYFTQNNLLKNYSLLSSEIWIGIDLRFAQSNIYQSGFFEYSQNLILLSILDTYWTDHIEKMDYIRDTISWRSYGQQNPLIEYNFEAFDSYQLMLQQIRNSVIYFLLEKPIYYFE
jgi:preprotein translocase subunit SecA